jgi:CelD/BcsL family acetyltransferase involved in cellulose biosynthesis
LIGVLMPKGHALLARLSRGEEPVGMIYGFMHSDKFYFYQSGISTNIGKDLRSPGIALNLLLMKKLAEEGISEYDFMRGNSSYKTRHTTTANRLVQFILRRQTARTRILSALGTTRKFVRYIRSRSGPIVSSETL